MLKSVKKKLENVDRECLFIGITQDGTERSSISVPWEGTATAMNMKLPEVYFSVEEISDAEAVGYLRENFSVQSCYIFVPLESYDFLAEFTDMIDLEIYYGKNVKSLDFMTGMKSWRMFYLEDAVLSDMSGAFPEDKDLTWYSMVNMALLECEVGDIDRVIEFSHNEKFFAELIIYRRRSQKDEKERWKKVRAIKYKYYYSDEE